MSGALPETPIVPDHTRDAQRRAADPRASAWVSANAGAGKTKVLTDRVVRLLLSGAPPGRILCLTFTKAAAANMAIRVFEGLGRWVTLDEDSLRAELEELEGVRPNREQVRLARRLFARAVETPGGLKIDTIHAFCERLLHLVPFEANVPARFAVLDESQADELVAEAIAQVPRDVLDDTETDLARAHDLVLAEAGGGTLDRVLKSAVACKDFASGAGGLAAGLGRLRMALGLEEGATVEAIERSLLEGGPTRERRLALGAILDAGKPNDQKRAASLHASLQAERADEALEHYLAVFLTEEGKPRAESQLATKSVGADVKAELVDEQNRILRLLDRRRAAQALDRTGALFTLAAAVVRKVEQTKARLGALDFEDLIHKTRTLLARGDAEWVLYKLDRGIDHVLVDEAQDTNPEQWDILRRITEDFTAGHGARGERVRTLFAVGDPKQSIYGFQGAAPQEFEISRKFWQKKVAGAALRFEDVRLTLSFRSCLAVLSAVDATFGVPEHFRGLSFEDSAVGTVHESARPHAPGQVELWPVETPAAEEEPDAWAQPVDEAERTSPPVVVARRVAEAVRAWTTRGDEAGRVWRAGDILILVRKRGTAFEAVIRALKDAGVPVAGADRLNIGEHIAVLDLVAAGRAALLPQDDLTLATALKSPLVGLTDDDLLRIAARRAADEPLADALQRHAEAGDGAARRGADALAAWQELARTRTPFGFFATLLGPGEGRRRLVARLGTEAGDAIDAFLCFTHNAELTETPSLTGFLSRFGAGDHTIKRDLDPARDEVRVMTVHGAKGLEAPLVVVIDGCEVLGRDPVLVPVEDGEGGTLPVWSSGAASDSGVIAQARAALRDKGHEEHNRLLYVAMTRAKDRLVIAPYLTGRRDSPQEAWCEMIRRGLVAKAGGVEFDEAPFGQVVRWRSGRPGGPAAAAAPSNLEPVEVPDWLTRSAEPEPEPLPPIRPSGALGAADRAARPGDGPFAPAARLRGTLVHALLERLPGIPDERRGDAARAYVATRAPRAAPEERDAMVRAALGVLEDAALRPLFGPASRAEVPIAGRVGTAAGPAAVLGQIDRLAVLDDAVLLADFKTTMRPPPADEPAPAAYVAQLALYRALLRDIYPDRPVRAFLIWTSGPAIRELAGEELDRALATIRAA